MQTLLTQNNQQNIWQNATYSSNIIILYSLWILRDILSPSSRNVYFEGAEISVLLRDIKYE